MLLERDKATVSTEPDNSGTTVVSAGELSVVTGTLTPVTKQDSPALSTTKTRKNANTQNPSPTPSTEGEGTVDDK